MYPLAGFFYILFISDLLVIVGFGERRFLRMRNWLNRNIGLAFSFAICNAAMAFGCDQLPVGQTLWIRLAAPISTYTAKSGDPVRAVLTQSLVCDDEIVLPMGTEVGGIVRSKRKVGWGIRHETAALELEFNHATTGTGIEFDLSARVEEVENARELVRKGVIQGIRSSDTFQGSINSRLIHLPTWNPYSDPFLMAYKATFPIFPEPEIHYAAGTEIRLLATKEILLPTKRTIETRETLFADEADSDRLDRLVEGVPLRVTTTKHLDADLLNIIFLGSEDQVRSAFRAAGWHNADPVSKHATLKSLYALLNNSGYPQEPMTTFILNGKPQDMNWQSSLNDYGRRDHLRIWQWKQEGATEPVWATSSTHDTAAVLSLKYRGFIHHIAPNIDEERSKVIRDLNFAGCVRSVSYVSRPEMPTITRNATGDVMKTDGSIAVIALQDCQPKVDLQIGQISPSSNFKPGSWAFRYIRRQILTFRNDIWRANIIYGVFEVGRRTITAFRRQPALTQ